MSGMSTLEQVEDNVKTYQNSGVLSAEEMHWLREDVNHLYRAAGPLGTDFSKYEGLKLYGADVTAIMEAYNCIQLQPDLQMSDENNYLKNVMAEQSHLDIHQDLQRQILIAADGTDVTDEVYDAYEFLRSHTF